jgi:hypothetical protein
MTSLPSPASSAIDVDRLYGEDSARCFPAREDAQAGAALRRDRFSMWLGTFSSPRAPRALFPGTQGSREGGTSLVFHEYGMTIGGCVSPRQPATTCLATSRRSNLRDGRAIDRIASALRRRSDSPSKGARLAGQRCLQDRLGSAARLASEGHGVSKVANDRASLDTCSSLDRRYCTDHRGDSVVARIGCSSPRPTAPGFRPISCTMASARRRTLQPSS